MNVKNIFQSTDWYCDIQ